MVTEKTKRINPELLRFLEALADETRLRILVSISESPKTVGQIHEQVGELTLSAVSHQLSYMSSLNMIECDKVGRSKHYRLSHRFCWCVLRDAFSYFDKAHKCPHCSNIEQDGGLLKIRR